MQNTYAIGSLLKSSSGSTWVPTYPQYGKSSGSTSEASLSTSANSLQEAKNFWNRNVEAYEEKVFRGNSPLKLLKVKGIAGIVSRSELSLQKLDGVPMEEPPAGRAKVELETVKQMGASPKVKAAPPLVPVNRWKESPSTSVVVPAASTPARLPPLHPSPPDSSATIPILPSTANVAWPPVRDGGRNPNSPIPELAPAYQTPRPLNENQRSMPGSVYSAFLPKFTPAGGPLISEGLVPLAGPPLEEDQYTMTEWADSDAEVDDDEKERRRMAKRIPAWCIGWIETAKTQTSIDPDTVFGTKIPKCDLDTLFGSGTTNAYLKARKGRRGSSGEWGMDRVSREELTEYRHVMGHTQQLESVVIIQQVIKN